MVEKLEKEIEERQKERAGSPDGMGTYLRCSGNFAIVANSPPTFETLKLTISHLDFWFDSEVFFPEDYTQVLMDPRRGGK